MFIKIWQPITLYIDRMDWRAGHLTTTEGTGGGGHLPTKIARRGRAFEQFFQMPGVCPGGGVAGGGCSRLELTYTLPLPLPLPLLYHLHRVEDDATNRM